VVSGVVHLRVGGELLVVAGRRPRLDDRIVGQTLPGPEVLGDGDTDLLFAVSLLQSSLAVDGVRVVELPAEDGAAVVERPLGAEALGESRRRPVHEVVARRDERLVAAAVEANEGEIPRVVAGDAIHRRYVRLFDIGMALDVGDGGTTYSG
jgi:hypothetical protein